MNRKQKIIDLLLLSIILINIHLGIFFPNNSNLITRAPIEQSNLRSNEEELWHFQSEEIITGVDISSDGEYIAAIAGFDQNRIYFFEKSNSTPFWSFLANGELNCIAISDNGKYIVGGTDDKKVHCLESSSNIPIWNYSAESRVNHVAISLNGSYVAAGSSSNTIIQNDLYLFNTTNSVNPHLWDRNPGAILQDIDMSGYGEYLVAGFSNYFIYMYNNIGTQLWNYQTGHYVNDVAISTDGNYIVAGTSWNDNKVYLFNTTNPSNPLLWQHDAGDEIFSLAISDNGSYIAAGTEWGKILLFNLLESSPLWTYRGNGDIESIEFSANGKYLVSGDTSGSLLLFETSKSKPIGSFHVDDFVRAAISSNGDYVVAACWYDGLYLFSREGLQKSMQDSEGIVISFGNYFLLMMITAIISLIIIIKIKK